VSANGDVGPASVNDAQRVRMLSAAAQVVNEHGYTGMSVARVTGRAGVSRRTFYDLFKDRLDCFLAVFDDGIARATMIAGVAYEAAPEDWAERIRAGLAALLGFFDKEPGLGALLVVDALGAGPCVLERRARVLKALARIVDEGRSGGDNRDGESTEAMVAPPALTAEGTVGAVLSVIHARMLQRDGHSRLQGLLNELVSMIVLPYRGAVAAEQELSRPVPRPPSTPPRPTRDPLEGLGMRLTYRTLRVLAVVAADPGASNRRVGEQAGVHDQGQISKLLARLERFGLVANTGEGQSQGEANAWALTARGLEVEHAIGAQTG
jgi:AcrR family transcriptional regulator